MKVPFGNLGDIWTKAKLDKDNDWYNSEASVVIQQMAGRPVRSMVDFATTYILDSNFSRIVPYMPDWFRSALVEM